MAEELETTQEVEELEPQQTEESGQESEETTDLETAEQETDESEQEEEAAKTFTQEELEAEIGKRLARERRKFERMQQQNAQPEPLNIQSQLDPDQFSTTEEYLEALATEKAEAIVAHRDHSKSVNEIEEKYQNQVDESLDKYPDYVQVAHTHKYMTADMASAIKASDIAVDLAYHLGTHLDEAERIFKLPPMLQIKELGKLEAKLEASPPETKKPSSAPAPIKPVTGSKTSVPAYETTDPRSAKTMTASEWIAKDRARREAAMRASGLR